jgi:hypothetical protein
VAPEQEAAMIAEEHLPDDKAPEESKARALLAN